MRRQLEPNPEVTHVWNLMGQLISAAHRQFPDPKRDGMSFAEDLYKRASLARDIAVAEALFYATVIRCHGPETVIERESGDFTLFTLWTVTD